MADNHIATYLNDHLAGSVAGLEIMEHLEAAHAGSPLADLLKGLRAEITADQQELETLMDALHISESRTRKASAWIAEKFTEIKLRLDDAASGDFRLFESLEVLSLGIEGKKSLWKALAAAAEDAPALRLTDYERLQQRAEEQRNRVEELRLEAAKKSLRPEPETDASTP